MSRSSLPPGPPAESAAAEAVQQRLAHLFRLSLQQGRIHPLYLPLQKYRQGRCDAA